MIKKIVLTLCLLFFFVGTALAGLNINTADQERLQQLTGIGPVTAAAIVEHREQHGLFKTVDELIEVRGIGPATLEKLRDSITVDD